MSQTSGHLKESVATASASMTPVGVGVGREVILEMVRRVAWTVVASLKLPMVLFFVLWELRSLGESQILAANLAQGVVAILPTWIVSMILYRAVSSHGLAGAMLRWPQAICDSLQRGLLRVLLMICPLLMASEVLKRYEAGAYTDSLGRFCLMGALFVMATVFYQITQAIVRLEGNQDQRRPTIWLAGGRGFHWLMTLFPVALGLFCGVGYRFAAEQLGNRMLWSLMVGLGILLAWSLVLHLFRLHEKRMRALIVGVDSLARAAKTELDGNAAQVVKLINVVGAVGMLWGMLQVWNDVIPLGDFLNQMQVWQGAKGVDGVVQWVTWHHLITAGLVVMVTGSISRNLPGLIELLLPTRLPLDKGGRFAIAFVARYVVALVGLMQASHLLGFSWDRVQWLAAGLTVGLGFGLQEVFANLVSGIIILMERPVRVGDYVSVNNITGTVSKMALRATTITDSDRREWIIPNKKFITDDVMNWTLTDTISRAVFAVSVPHGSDTRRVQQILLDVAKRQSVVMDYPEPSAVLVKIGTRSLDYELRVFLASRSGYSILQNQLHMELIDALGEAGIDVTISMGDSPYGSQPAAGTVVSLPSAVNASGAGSSSKKAA